MNRVASGVRHPALELLGRYAEVFRAAWSARGELAGPRRLADETAFLPAALSLQETPAHPAPRRAMRVIMGLFAAAVAWSVIGQVMTPKQKKNLVTAHPPIAARLALARKIADR